MTTINKGRIASGGQGGFLFPPTHPEHSQHIESTKRNDFSMSLSSAAACEWLDDGTKAIAKVILNAWQRPAIDSPEIQDWICHVLGYFRNCYTRDKAIRSVNNKNTFYISKDENEPVDHHLGVLHIQEYYPEYLPLKKHFDGAYWGTKK